MTRFAASLTALILLTCCGDSLPPLPQVDLARLNRNVRAAVEPALVAAQRNPQSASDVARLGMILHAHSEYISAASAYRRAARIQPDNPEYRYYLGAVLSATGHYEEAVTALEASLRLRASTPVRLSLASGLYAAGHVVEAREQYLSLVAADPNLAAAWYGLGQCQKGAEAVQSFQDAVRLFPRYGAARFALAGVYRQLGRQADSLAALQNYDRDKFLVPPLADSAMAAVQALDVSPQGLVRAAQALEREEKLVEASELLERALAADTSFAQAAASLVGLYGKLGQPEKAEVAYRKAMAVDPGNAAANYNYGVLCLRQERLADARVALEKTVAAEPANAAALDSLGAVIETSGDWAGAAELFRKAIAADSTLRLAHFHLGRIYANQKRYADSIAELGKIQEPVDSQTPGFLYALGATHARAGNRAEALLVLTRAQEMAMRQGQGELAFSIDRDLATLRRLVK